MRSVLLIALIAVVCVACVSAAPAGTSSHALGKMHIPRPALEFEEGATADDPVFPVGGDVWPVAIYFMSVRQNHSQIDQAIWC